MVSLISIKKISIIRKIDKCVLFSGSNSFIFAFLKNFFNYELIYSIRVNIILNGKVDASLKKHTFLKLLLIKIQFKFLYFLESYIVKKSDKIIFQSQINADEYKKMYSLDKNKIFILNNNCNPTWIGGEKKLKLKKGFNIGFIGNLHLNKGVCVILDALKLVKKIKSNCNLTIIGDGPDRIYFENYMNDLSLNDIEFLGQKKNAFEFMNNFDLIIVPSYMEAFPNVVLEALYYNIPILGSNVGGIPLILNNSQLFEAGDYKALSDKILNMFNNDYYEKNLALIKKIRKKFLFDWGNEFYNIIKL